MGLLVRSTTTDAASSNKRDPRQVLSTGLSAMRSSHASPWRSSRSVLRLPEVPALSLYRARGIRSRGRAAAASDRLSDEALRAKRRDHLSRGSRCRISRLRRSRRTTCEANQHQGEKAIRGEIGECALAAVATAPAASWPNTSSRGTGNRQAPASLIASQPGTVDKSRQSTSTCL